MATLGVGIIGAGWVAGEYVKVFRDDPRTELVGVAGRTPGKPAALLRQHGVEAREYASVDELFAAICTYVLLAMAFACVYAIQERLAPGSFSALAAPGTVTSERYWDLVYFSFTVLTSTGFGDIHPLARHARAVVMIEQVTGVMYVAILIARLTGMNLVRSSR